MTSLRRPGGRRDDGITLIVVGLAMVALLLVVAIVIDLGYTRSDRRSGQLAVDNAATSGAARLTDEGTDGADACEAALHYLGQALETSFTAGCSSLATCDDSNPPVTTTADGYTVTIEYPVVDSSDLLEQSSTIGADPTPFAADFPGFPCERIGVELTTTGNSLFGGIGGQADRTSTAHAVAVVSAPPDTGRLINLAVLDREACDAIGTSGNGGVVAEAVQDVDEDGNPVTLPGSISVDSDASDGCGPTVRLGGTSALVRADGPPGCVGELVAGTGEGCGRIELFAEGPPGCNTPACDEGTGTVAPEPVRVLDQLTRAPVDHKYNCKGDYESESWYDVQPITRCPATATRQPYIDQLEADIGSSGTPAGFVPYTGPCTINPGVTITVGPGNYHVSCDPLSIKGTLVFEGGNVVFDHDIRFESAGHLSVNTANPDTTYPWSGTGSVDHQESSSAAAFIYLRGGDITKVAQASITLRNTMGYLGSTSTLDFAGGSGVVSWIAPTAGPFADLALWSEGTATAGFGGSAGMVLDGTYFVPLATVEYRGSGGNDVTAQFVANKLSATGNGFLTLTPTRGIRIPARPSVITLVR